MSLSNNFPVDKFPPIIRNAVYEVQRNTQAPLPLITASVLGAISLACQGRVDVCRPNNLRGPVSLFLLTIAESGERKSTVDKLLMQPLYKLEAQLTEQYSRDFSAYRNNVEIFNAEKKVLLSKMKLEVKNSEDTSSTKEKLSNLLHSYPKEPVRYRLIFSDTTPAAIKDYLCGMWRYISIMSDEGGAVLSGYALNELPLINKLWDGSTVPVERKKAPGVSIKDARLTLSLMVQPDIFKEYVEQKGSKARGIGFFARCFICQPDSTQGTRQITNPVLSTEHLHLFHKRLVKITNENITKDNKDERITLYFSRDAEKGWIEAFNRVESALGLMGSLSNFKDYASKVAENVARVAALLHHFSEDEGDISLATLESSMSICQWYLDEHVRLFTKPNEQDQINIDADELFFWIKDFCSKSLTTNIRRNKILQYGPNKFRNRSKTNELLNFLQSQGRIRGWQEGKTVFVQLINTGDFML